jgi:transaldolase
MALGYVSGVTTNPTLMRTQTEDPLRQLAEILSITDAGRVFYQPCGAYGPLQEEADSARSISPERVVIKLPSTPTGCAVAGDLVRDGCAVALTAAQSPTAMVAAEAIGCLAVIPYVDRALRDPGTDDDLVRALARVRHGDTGILAASVKNVGQLMRAVVDGADAVTAPFGVLRDLVSHPASLAAESAFAGEFAPGPLLAATTDERRSA